MDITKHALFSAFLFCAACGGGGSESASTSNTTVNNCPGESIEISSADLPEVVNAAVEAGVDVQDFGEDSAPVEDNAGVDQSTALRTGGVVIATCGGTVVANDSQDNDTVSQVKRALYSGQVYRLEIYRGE